MDIMVFVFRQLRCLVHVLLSLLLMITSHSHLISFTSGRRSIGDLLFSTSCCYNIKRFIWQEHARRFRACLLDRWSLLFTGGVDQAGWAPPRFYQMASFSIYTYVETATGPILRQWKQQTTTATTEHVTTTLHHFILFQIGLPACLPSSIRPTLGTNKVHSSQLRYIYIPYIGLSKFQRKSL